MLKYIIQEIMKLPPENNVSLINSLNIINRYAKVSLMTDNNHNIYYQVPLSSVIMSDISTDELIQIRNGGWELNEENNFLIKYM